MRWTDIINQQIYRLNAHRCLSQMALHSIHVIEPKGSRSIV